MYRVLLVLSIAAVAGEPSVSPGASTTTTVGATVLSATTLSSSACSPASRNLGSLAVGATAITPTDCRITFGSSNDTAALRLTQSDGAGSTLTQFASAATTLQAAPRMVGVATNGASEAWFVGIPGIGSIAPIVHTTDGGSTWTTQTCAGASGLYAADRVTASTVIAVGNNNVICRTTDGGTTWTRPTGPASGIHWRSIDMLPSGEGWIVGYDGRVGHTTDSGATWTALPHNDPTLILAGVAAASSSVLHASGYRAGTLGTPYNDSVALKSVDGGVTWAETTLFTNQVNGTVGSIALLDPTHLVTVGNAGIFLTTDGGATWTRTSTGSRQCVAAFDASTLVAFQSTTSPPVRSTDGGVTWTALASPPVLTGTMNACGAASPSAAYIGGYNDQRLVTTDVGLTYTITPSPYRDQKGAAAWNSAKFVTVGDLGSIRRTSNGGSTFTQPTSGVTSGLTAVDTVGAATAVAVGVSGTIRQSTDSGVTWAGVTSGTAATLRSIDHGPDGDLYVAGDSGIVLRSADAGATWATRTAPAVTTLNGVAAFGPDGLWVVGNAGVIYRSTDRGATWTTQTSGTALNISSIDAYDDQRALATTVSSSGLSYILRTTDGGATWSTVFTTPVNSNIYQVRYLNDTTAVVGNVNGYLRTTDAGTTWTAVNATTAYAVAPLDTNSFIIAGASDAIAKVMPGASFGDYASPGADFSGAASTFGACLHTATGVSATSWPVAGTGNCTAGNATMWRGIAMDSVDPTAKVASTASGGTADLNFRFGAKPGAAQASGAYSAGIRFEVIAPDV